MRSALPSEGNSSSICPERVLNRRSVIGRNFLRSRAVEFGGFSAISIVAAGDCGEGSGQRGRRNRVARRVSNSEDLRYDKRYDNAGDKSKGEEEFHSDAGSGGICERDTAEAEGGVGLRGAGFASPGIDAGGQAARAGGGHQGLLRHGFQR